MHGTTRSHPGAVERRAPAAARALVRAVLLAALAAAASTVAGGTARAAERTASWSVGPLEVVAKGKVRRMAEGTLVDGYGLRAPARLRGDGPLDEATLVLLLSTFHPAKDLPGQPKGLYYVKGTWRLVPAKPAAGGGARSRAEGLQGSLTAALPSDPTAGGGGFTLRTRVSPGGGRGVRAGDGTLTVNDRLEAELNLSYR